MKILHVSDFHYRYAKTHIVKQERIIEKFVSFNEQKKDVDLIIFSGDLVQNGTNYNDFEEAKRMLLDPFLKENCLDKSRIVICPGNHDNDREESLEAVVKYMDGIGSNDDLNEFIKKKDFEVSHAPIKNYLKFVTTNFKLEGDHFEPLFSAQIKKIKNTDVGIVTINTAWRALGQNDEGSLLFPTQKMEEAIFHVKDCEFKILVMHHPLTDFKRFNATELEDIFHKNFDLILSGHIHRGKDSIDITTSSGLIKIGAPAALTYPGKDTEIGLGIIQFDFDEAEFTICKHLYDSNNDMIYLVPKGTHQIPTDDVKKKRNRFRIKIKHKLELELERAKDLLVSRSNEDGGKSFLDLCADPVIKYQSVSEISDESSVVPDFDVSEFQIATSDFLVLGKGKCGKTVLLKKIQIELLSSFNEKQVFPFYIDCKEWTKTNKKLDLISELRKYYELSKDAIDAIIHYDEVVLLLDNFQSRSATFVNDLSSQIKGKSNLRLIVVSDETILNTIEEVKIDDRILSKLYFHRLRKKHIKQLTKKIHNLTNEKEDEIVEKINSIFTRMSIPFNFWTISLFLWIFKKDLNSNFQNDVELINLYIEKLLEKERLTVEQSSFGYDKFKRFLANLAHHLLTNNHHDSYCAKYEDLLKFTEEYLGKNPRYNISPKEVLEYVEERGIIGKKNNEYSFRLNGVFEYFIAQYMVIDNTFLNKIIQDDNFYLDFANEFELYAGFKRDDQEFLNKIFAKTQGIYNSVNDYYSQGGVTPDSLLKSKMLELTGIKPMIEKITEKLKNGLTLTEQDEIEEEFLRETGLSADSNSEVRQKQIKILNDSIESLEVSLRILGSVYKNVDEINNQAEVYEIFDFIVGSAINWGFKLIDEITLVEIKELLKSDQGDEAKALLRLITNFIPTVVESRLNDMIGHKNLEGIILERIELYKMNPNENQYKLFIMYFLLSDINLNKHMEKLNELTALIKLPILKYSNTLKLNYYLGFKTNDDPEKAQYLKNLLQTQQLRFDNQTDLGSLHKSLSEKSQKNNLKPD